MFQTSMGLSGSSWLLWMQGCGDLEWLERHNIITWRVFQPCRQFLLPLEHHLTLFYLRLQMNTNSDKYKFLSVGMPISQAPTCLIPTCLIPTLMLFSLVRWKGLCTKLDQETAFPDHWRSWNSSGVCTCQLCLWCCSQVWVMWQGIFMEYGHLSALETLETPDILSWKIKQ